MKRKAFTLVELLVVIAIIAMLLAILMPALNRVKQLAYRVVCGAHLRGIGQGVIVYASDFEDEYPVTGGQQGYWSNPKNMTWKWKVDGPDPCENNTKNDVTVSSCLYLLVKYSEVPPDEFVCKGDDAKKLDLSKYLTTGSATARDCWDFGPPWDSNDSTGSWMYVSYAYHMPFRGGTSAKSYAASQMSPVTNAVIADKNPWLDPRSDTSTTAKVTNLNSKFTTYKNASPEFSKTEAQMGNSHNHAQEGQNVMFNDTHVRFEQGANCASENDNIYTCWGTATSTAGVTDIIREAGAVNPQPDSLDDSTFFPYNDSDSVLINDGEPTFMDWGTTP
ncbi:MAG: type II secretion system protein [Planctomycetota bacterium]